MTKRPILFAVAGFSALAVVSIAVPSARSPLAGSHIEFLRDASVEDCYGFVPMQGGGITRVQMIDIPNGDFGEINRLVASKVSGMPSLYTTGYMKIELRALSVSRGNHYRWPNRSERGVDVVEKKEFGKTWVEVTEFTPLNKVDSYRTRMNYIGRNMSAAYYVKRDESQLAAGDPQADLQS